MNERESPVRPGVDFAGLYDAHPEYDARRREGSFEREQVALEVQHFKLPHLAAVLAMPWPQRVLEIGCATGELIGAVPAPAGSLRMGLDISARNIAVARERFPHVSFHAGDVHSLRVDGFDAVVLSDVLEHVSDDTAFLADAARLGHQVLINLPLETNWLNRGRAYGPEDVSGHLRAYSLDAGLRLIARAGLQVLRWHQVWVHETPVEALRRQLRVRHHGHAYSGAWPARLAKQGLLGAAVAVRPFGRRLLASNLFALAVPNGAGRGP